MVCKSNSDSGPAQGSFPTAAKTGPSISHAPCARLTLSWRRSRRLGGLGGSSAYPGQVQHLSGADRRRSRRRRGSRRSHRSDREEAIAEQSAGSDEARSRDQSGGLVNHLELGALRAGARDGRGAKRGGHRSSRESRRGGEEPGEENVAKHACSRLGLLGTNSRIGCLEKDLHRTELGSVRT